MEHKVKCPLYGNITDCNDDCMLIRHGINCSTIMAATYGEQNQEKLDDLLQRITNIEIQLSQIVQVLNQTKNYKK